MPSPICLRRFILLVVTVVLLIIMGSIRLFPSSEWNPRHLKSSRDSLHERSVSDKGKEHPDRSVLNRTKERYEQERVETVNAHYKKSRRGKHLPVSECSIRKYKWTTDELGTLNHSGTAVPEYKFTDVHASGIHILPDVCLEIRDPCSCDIAFQDDSCRCRKTFVAYNTNVRGEFSLPVRIAPEWVSHQNSYLDIVFRRGRIPPTHRIINHVPTYFLTHSFDGNLYHFWNDSFIGLYGIMKATGRLGAPEGNQLLYREDEWECEPRSRAHDLSRYENFTFTLSVLPKHDWFQQLPENTCFSRAIFGHFPHYDYPDEPYMYVKDNILGSDYLSQCPEKRVVILQRLNRRIINAEELRKAATERGYVNTDVYTFEYLTLKQQLAVIACTNILVGVQGAGLQWFHFARTKRALVEIAWHNWPSFFAEQSGDRAVVLSNQRASLNWASYEAADRPGKRPLTAEEKADLLDSNSEKETMEMLHKENVWKWADVTVDIPEFVDALDVAGAMIS